MGLAGPVVPVPMFPHLTECFGDRLSATSIEEAPRCAIRAAT
jgi:hypothetical protein